MPHHIIDQSEEEGLEYARMVPGPEDIELTECRDTEEDVAKAIKEISKSHSWSWLGEEGKRIQKVLADVDDDDDVMKALEAWQNYLEKALTFPFDAEVSEYPGMRPLKDGDKVSVRNITVLDDDYGIFVELLREHKRYLFPLGNLEVINKDSANYRPVKDYCIWFANSEI